MGDLRNDTLWAPLCQGLGEAWALPLLMVSKSTRPGSLFNKAWVWPHYAWWWSFQSRAWLFLALRGLEPSAWRESTDAFQSNSSCPNSPSPGVLPKPGWGYYCTVSNFRQMASSMIVHIQSQNKEHGGGKAIEGKRRVKVGRWEGGTKDSVRRQWAPREEAATAGDVGALPSPAHLPLLPKLGAIHQAQSLLIRICWMNAGIPSDWICLSHLHSLYHV